MTNSILITGCNRGIGLELCRQYALSGWHVHACCRKPDSAAELQQLASEQNKINIHALDVSDTQQIKDLSNHLDSVPIDILFNNAGVYGQGDAYFGNTDEEKWIECFRINTISPLKMMENFVSHIAASEQKIIATMSSKMGSMDDNGSGGSYVYRSSKAAINAVMVSASIDLSPQNIKVAILHPGWVKTDMGGPNAEISTEQSVTQIKHILSNLTADTSGRFFDIDGSIIPW